METITLFIDGQPVRTPKETQILTAAQAHGIYIPHLCAHSNLTPVGACRLCLVEDQDSGRLLASCVTAVRAEMRVLTRTPRIERHRRNIVRLMMAEHPESCIVCDKGNRCRLRRVAAELGVAETRLYAMPHYREADLANPFMTRDLAKCIFSMPESRRIKPIKPRATSWRT